MKGDIDVKELFTIESVLGEGVPSARNQIKSLKN
jgi:hypothetical protein